MTTFICISGKARNGKDETAKQMKEVLECLNKRVVIAHYADLVKFICTKYFDWDGQKDEKGRTLLQQIGTEAVRTKYPDFWVDFVLKVIELFPDRWDCVIVSDTRFPNEITKVEQSGYKVIHIRVQRDNFDNGLTEEQKQHASEIALDGVEPTYTIHNNGTIADLRTKVESVVFAIEHNLHAICDF